jgi:SEC-C motif-containing protein
MSLILANKLCPCGSGQPLAVCCGVYLDGLSDPPTAEALMRSRYTAFVLGRADHLLRTWDLEHRPPRLDLSQDKTEWLGLEVVKTESGGKEDSHGQVEFIARFRLHGREQALSENSRFRKQDGRWLYVDGKTSLDPGAAAAAAPGPKVGRNDPCPCGSGQKFKRCCGK